MKSICAGSEQHIVRPTFQQRDGSLFYDHKGFNWRHLKQKLAERFVIDDIIASPVPVFGPQFASQVWIVGRKRSR